MYEAVESCDTCQPVARAERAYCRHCGLLLAEPRLADAVAPRRRWLPWS